MHQAIPLLLPRRARATVEVGGYTISEAAQVQVGHRQGPYHIEEPGGVHSGEVLGVGIRCQGTKLQALAVRRRLEDMPAVGVGHENVAPDARFAYQLLRQESQ